LRDRRWLLAGLRVAATKRPLIVGYQVGCKRANAQLMGHVQCSFSGRSAPEPTLNAPPTQASSQAARPQLGKPEFNLATRPLLSHHDGAMLILANDVV
jgi:hypothetical protein